MCKKKVSVKCLCGGIFFKINGKLRNIINCHCIQCTKTHGHYAAYTSTLDSNIQFISKRTLKWYHSSKKAKRGFCNNCGASIFFKRFRNRAVSISAGLFKNPSKLKTISHIYVQNKRDYYKIEDKLPKFKKYT